MSRQYDARTPGLFMREYKGYSSKRRVIATFIGYQWDADTSNNISSARIFCNIPDYIDGMVMYKYIAIVCHQNKLEHSERFWMKIMGVWVTWLALPINILSILS